MQVHLPCRDHRSDRCVGGANDHRRGNRRDPREGQQGGRNPVRVRAQLRDHCKRARLCKLQGLQR